MAGIFFPPVASVKSVVSIPEFDFSWPRRNGATETGQKRFSSHFLHSEPVLSYGRLGEAALQFHHAVQHPEDFDGRGGLAIKDEPGGEGPG